VAGTYREINYRLRPAKHVERLMLTDMFRRLKFANIESYQYLGLGSVYFTDFLLFHRALGLSSMTCVEKETHDQDRFNDNLPFSKIKMEWGLTTERLPHINLSMRTIAWLDYDGRVSTTVLDDVRYFVAHAPSGSVLVVTVQCNPEKFDSTSPRKHVTKLANEIGAEKVDPALDDEALLGWGCADLFRRIIFNQIAATLAMLNGVRSESQKMQFEQTVYFQYEDDARMMTVGGVLFDRGQKLIFDQCAFSDLEFYRAGEEPFRIDIPKLTTKEIAFLDRQMPLALGENLTLGSIPLRDAQQYIRIYRYFPNFVAVVS
jgi:hypothetical protein